MSKQRIVLFSGGIGSWAAAKRVAERFGTTDLMLLFADTFIEDEDLYRFLEEAAANINAPLVCVADGRTPWQVYRDERTILFKGHAPCSVKLKTIPTMHWIEEHCVPSSTIIYLGIDWTEKHRLAQRRANSYGWTFDAPMCTAPYLTKEDMLALARSEGLTPPRMYAEGFPHNNCGGFCVKAGKLHFAHLLQQRPDYYHQCEQQEEELVAYLMATGKRKQRPYFLMDYTKTGPQGLSMRELRERIESNTCDTSGEQMGGCGCFLDDDVTIGNER